MLLRAVQCALASALVLVCTSLPAFADEAEAKAAIIKLLEVGWEPTAQARTAADLQYQEVQRLAGTDPAALTASLLVLMQQRRYDDAHKRLEELLAKDADDLTTLRAYVWIAAIRKNYTSSMRAANKLGEVLAADADKTPALDREELIGFLGRVFGYFAGPVGETASQDQRKLYEKQILARLGESERQWFEDGRDGVLQKFLEVTDAKSDDRDQALADAAAAKEKTLADIESDRQRNSARADELRDLRSKLESELRAELAQIAKEDAPLVAQLGRLNAQAQSLSQTLFNFEADIARFQRLASMTQDPNLKREYQLDAQQASFLASRVAADLANVEGQAQGVANQRGALAARQQRAQAAAGDQVARMDREMSELAKREKRNDGIEKRTGKPATGTTAKGLALSAQATALSTYDQFPLEIARQKLLESLR
ncbi:MAG: hypothetical protein SFU86_21260 [Pirellulaceae bacterium]|nr:hypothetical protein [Pirellulaceae bacterium]